MIKKIEIFKNFVRANGIFLNRIDYDGIECAFISNTSSHRAVYLSLSNGHSIHEWRSPTVIKAKFNHV